MARLDLAQQWLLLTYRPGKQRHQGIAGLAQSAALLCDLALVGAVALDADEFPDLCGSSPFLDAAHVAVVQRIRGAEIAQPGGWLASLAMRVSDVLPGIAGNLRRRDLLPPSDEAVDHADGRSGGARRPVSRLLPAQGQIT